jgi:hypothetical protein
MCKEQQHQCMKSSTNVKQKTTSHKTSINTMQDKQQHQCKKKKTTPQETNNNTTREKHQQQKKKLAST